MDVNENWSAFAEVIVNMKAVYLSLNTGYFNDNYTDQPAG